MRKRNRLRVVAGMQGEFVGQFCALTGASRQWARWQFRRWAKAELRKLRER